MQKMRFEKKEKDDCKKHKHKTEFQSNQLKDRRCSSTVRMTQIFVFSIFDEENNQVQL